MRAMLGMIRRALLRWQLRSLDLQAKHIVQARDQAMTRLMEIRLNQEIKERELMRQNAAALQRLRFY